jgi:hypothetical protein
VTPSTRLSRTYLVECYKPGLDRAEVEVAADRALGASAELCEEGHKVEYVGAILVPGDEVVFHVFVSECECTVREASVRASVAYERVVESIAVGQLQLGSNRLAPEPAL